MFWVDPVPNRFCPEGGPLGPLRAYPPARLPTGFAWAIVFSPLRRVPGPCPTSPVRWGTTAPIGTPARAGQSRSIRTLALAIGLLLALRRRRRSGCRSTASGWPTAWRIRGCRRSCRARAAFLWVGTGEGLSRFDGGRFASWGRGDGLAMPEIRAIAEARGRRALAGDRRRPFAGGGAGDFTPCRAATRLPGSAGWRSSRSGRTPRWSASRSTPARGELWVSTFGGLYRARPHGRRRRRRLPAGGGPALRRCAVVGARARPGRPPFRRRRRRLARDRRRPRWCAMPGRAAAPSSRWPPARTAGCWWPPPAGWPSSTPAADRLPAALRRRAGRADPGPPARPGRTAPRARHPRRPRAAGDGPLAADRPAPAASPATTSWRSPPTATAIPGSAAPAPASAAGRPKSWPASAPPTAWPSPSSNGSLEWDGQVWVRPHRRRLAARRRRRPLRSPRRRRPRPSDSRRRCGPRPGRQPLLREPGGRADPPRPGRRRADRSPCGDGLGGAEIAALALDGGGALWLALPGFGLARAARPAGRAGIRRFSPPPKASSSDEIRTLCVDRQDRLWLGSGRGLDLFEPAKPPSCATSPPATASPATRCATSSAPRTAAC